MDPLKVIIADDHRLVRAGIRSLLEELADVEVIAEAGNGSELLELIEANHPDLVLTDIAMPDMNGLEATAVIAAKYPNIKVIILSMYASEEYVWQAFEAGAGGYLLKDAAPLELELSIRTVMNGSKYMSPVVSQQVVNDYVRNSTGGVSWKEMLTPRQREVWQLIAEGKNTKDIAALLEISPKTVETHRSQLMERLGVYDVVGLVKLAIKAGLIAPRD
ncbi:MAG: response regulator transcription factor [Syntrophomonadaceae bacterium]|nr:response regulator transcription factor [Syntrophomonadaceae bacterium]